MDKVKEAEMNAQEKELAKKYGAGNWQIYLNIFNTLLTSVLTTLNQGLGILNLFPPGVALFLLDFLQEKINQLFIELRKQIEEADKALENKEKTSPAHLELLTNKTPQ